MVLRHGKGGGGAAVQKRDKSTTNKDSGGELELDVSRGARLVRVVRVPRFVVDDERGQIERDGGVAQVVEEGGGKMKSGGRGCTTGSRDGGAGGDFGGGDGEVLEDLEVGEEAVEGGGVEEVEACEFLGGWIADERETSEGGGAGEGGEYDGWVGPALEVDI